MAERAGFEPAVRLSPYTRFPGVRLKPLIHLSGEAEFYHRMTREAAANSHKKSPPGGGLCYGGGEGLGRFRHDVAAQVRVAHVLDQLLRLPVRLTG